MKTKLTDSWLALPYVNDQSIVPQIINYILIQHLHAQCKRLSLLSCDKQMVDGLEANIKS